MGAVLRGIQPASPKGAVRMRKIDVAQCGAELTSVSGLAISELPEEGADG